MTVAFVLSLALLAWSAISNLVVGDQLYIARNLVLVVLLVLGARGAGMASTGLGMGREAVLDGLRWGRNTALVVILVVGAAVVLRDVLPVVGSLLSDRRAALSGAELAWATLVRIPFGTALFEEVAFRGVLLGLLLQVTSPGWAVAWSSVVFGLWHVPPTLVALRLNEVDPGSPAGIGALVGAVVITTIAGVVFAVLRLIAGSLLAPILGHWATNAVGLLAAWFTEGEPAEAR